MTFEDIQKVNKKLKTTDVKGRPYVEVNERIKAFRELYPEGSIETNIEHLDNGVVVMSCTLKDDKGKVLAKAKKKKKENSSFINKTSFIENCCTSCTGRAIGYMGIGIDTSVASYEEVANAIENQKDKREWQVDDTPLISTEQVQILKKTQEKYNLSDERAKQILNDYNYKSFEEVKMSDFAKIGNTLSK